MITCIWRYHNPGGDDCKTCDCRVVRPLAESRRRGLCEFFGCNNVATAKESHFCKKHWNETLWGIVKSGSCTCMPELLEHPSIPAAYAQAMAAYQQSICPIHRKARQPASEQPAASVATKGA